MTRTLRALTATALFIPFTLASPAVAQVCAATDPTCIVDGVVDAVENAGDDPAGSAGGAVGDGGDTARGAADDAVTTVQGTADDAVSTVRNTIDDILNNGGNPPPGGGGPDPENGGGNGPGGGPGNDPAGDGGRHPLGAVAGRAGSSHPAMVASVTPAAPSGGSFGGNGVAHPTDRGTGPTLAQVAAGVVVGIAFMALLLGAVAAFLAVQDRLDRRDPKLVAATLGPDRVPFA